MKTTTDLTIYFHIGQPKTGSSAIQALLDHNREVLAKKYFLLYPNINQPDFATGQCHNHTRFFEEARHNAKIDFCIKTLQICIDFCNQQKITTLIISNEGFYDSEWPKLLKDILARLSCNYRFILYLRRQDHWAESAWKQWWYKQPEYGSIHDFVREKSLNWMGFFKIALNYFNIADFNVYPFEKESIGVDIVRHFMSILNIEDMSGLTFPLKNNTNTNQGFTAEVMELLRLCRSQATDIRDHSLIDFLAEALPEKFKKTDPFSSYGILSADQRLDIVNRYREPNETLGKLIFGPTRNNFFLEPDPESDSTDIRNTEIKLESIVPVLVELLIHQQHQINSLRQEITQISTGIEIPLETIIKKGKFSKDVTSVVAHPESIEINSSGPDPYVIFQRIARRSNRLVVKIVITTPCDTTLQLFYKTKIWQPYHEQRSLRQTINHGRQSAIFVIQATKITRFLRLDPGCHPGQYFIHLIEIS